ncbi:MAG: DEAD/DEAH box helicase, partial [Hyphomicrobium sp.]|nr:DEAD/DEAH box helicase [Hyphomicrobium sp.]
LFSATMPAEIKKFAYDILQDPYRIDLSSKTIVVDRIDQKIMMVRTPEKQSRLHTILADEEAKRVIVFTRTKRGADRVADRLGMAGISSAAFHGNKAQNARQRALNDFTLGHIRVLVATDIAARGIDVSNITHVVNFDMPLDPETYVHRVGRTARKGTTGIAISLCDPSERGEIRAIERMMKQPLVVMDDVGGEVRPMPERRRDDDAPRRQGAPRGGRGGEGHRGRPGFQGGAGRNRSEHPAGDRSNGHSDDRRRDRPQRRPYDPAASIAGPAAEGAAKFGVADREHKPRSADRPRHDGPHRGPRGDRPSEHRQSEHRQGEHRQGEHRAGGHRGDNRGHARPSRHSDDARHTDGVRRADGARPDRNHGPAGRHRDETGTAKREGGHGPRKPHHGGGEGRPSWKGGSDAPKFMKRREEGDRSRVRPPR